MGSAVGLGEFGLFYGVEMRGRTKLICVGGLGRQLVRVGLALIVMLGTVSIHLQ